MRYPHNRADAEADGSGARSAGFQPDQSLDFEFPGTLSVTYATPCRSGTLGEPTQAIHEDRALVSTEKIEHGLCLIAWTAFVRRAKRSSQALCPDNRLDRDLSGIIFRFTSLPVRTVYFDEAYTFMRVSGQTESAMWKALYDGKPRTAAELRLGNATVDAHSSPQLLVASLI